jgi:hypothetical protein
LNQASKEERNNALERNGGTDRPRVASPVQTQLKANDDPGHGVAFVNGQFFVATDSFL